MRVSFHEWISGTGVPGIEPEAKQGKSLVEGLTPEEAARCHLDCSICLSSMTSTTNALELVVTITRHDLRTGVSCWRLKTDTPGRARQQPTRRHKNATKHTHLPTNTVTNCQRETTRNRRTGRSRPRTFALRGMTKCQRPEPPRSPAKSAGDATANP